MFINVSRLGA